jgi:hypothetical protein
VLRFLILALVFALAFAAMLIPRRGAVAGALWAVPLGAAMAIAVRAGLSPDTRRDMRLLQRAKGLTSMSDGDMVAVCGTVEARAETLRSPIHDEEVVVYLYQMHHRERTGRKSTRQFVDYAGFGIVPAAVRSTELTVKLGSFPLLHDFGKLAIQHGATEHAARFVRSARFDPLPAGEMIEYVDLMDKPWDGRSRYTVNFRRMEGYDPARDVVWEQRVRAGTPVCAIGIWSESERALVGAKDKPLRLFEGSADEVRALLGQGVGAGRALALLLTVGCVALTAWLIQRGG